MLKDNSFGFSFFRFETLERKVTSQTKQFHPWMNYYNNISNILFEFLYIFQFLEQKFPIGTEKTGESNPKSKLNSNSRIVEKVWAKLDNVSRASADRKVEVIPPIIKPDLPAEIAKRVLSFSLSSAERKLPFYCRE